MEGTVTSAIVPLHPNTVTWWPCSLYPLIKFLHRLAIPETWGGKYSVAINILKGGWYDEEIVDDAFNDEFSDDDLVVFDFSSLKVESCDLKEWEKKEGFRVSDDTECNKKHTTTIKRFLIYSSFEFQ